MQAEDFFDLKICKLSSDSELREISIARNVRKYDLIEVEGKFPALGFVRPKKITWRAYLTGLSDPIKIIKSRKLGKNIQKWSKNLYINGFEIVKKKDLSKDDFLLWLDVYMEMIGSKRRPSIKINKSWWEEKVSKGRKVGAIFLFKNGQFLGGNILTFGKDRLLVGYGILKDNFTHERDVNFGALIDFWTIRWSFELKMPIVSFGKDTNLYGFHLSSGLFSYKTRLGLTCGVSRKEDWVTTKFLNFEKFDDKVVFVSENNGYLVGNVFYRGLLPEEREFRANGLKGVSIIKQEDLLKKSAGLIEYA